MINTLVAKVFGTKNEREVKRMLPTVEAINALEPAMQKLSDAELRAKTDEFRQRIQDRRQFVALGTAEANLGCKPFSLRTVCDDDLVLADRMPVPAGYNTEFQQHLLYVDG